MPLSRLPLPPARALLSRRRWLLLGAAALVARLFGGEPARPNEDQVKAAFLYNFTKFIEWPDTAFALPESPFVIGVYGRPALVRELEKLVRGRAINGRLFVIKPLRSAAEASTTQLVFLGPDESVAAEVCRRVSGRPVLVVGDSETALRLGATIGFFFEGENLRFALRLEPAESAQLRISAQVQKLARVVQKGE